MSFPYQPKDIVLVRVACGNIYYAKIVTVNREHEECLAEFDDGSKASVPWKNIFDVKAETDVIVCVVCKDGTSDSPNEIILCDSCNVGYHQNCHRTTITSAHIAQEKWFCMFCVNKKKNPYLKNPFDEKKERLMKERLARRENKHNLPPLQEQRPGKRMRQKTKFSDEEGNNKLHPPAKRRAIETNGTLHQKTDPKHHIEPYSNSLSSSNGSNGSNGSSINKPSKCINKKPLSHKAHQQYKDYSKKLKNPIKTIQSKGLMLKSRPMSITPHNLCKRFNYPVPINLPPLIKSPIMCPQKDTINTITNSYQPPPLIKADISNSHPMVANLSLSFNRVKNIVKPAFEDLPLKSPLISPPKTNIFDSPIFKLSLRKGKESPIPQSCSDVLSKLHDPSNKISPTKSYNQKSLTLEIDRMYENIQSAHFSLNNLTAKSALLEQTTTSKVDESIQTLLGIKPRSLNEATSHSIQPVQSIPKFPDSESAMPNFLDTETGMTKFPDTQTSMPKFLGSQTAIPQFPDSMPPFPDSTETQQSKTSIFQMSAADMKPEISVCKAEVMGLKAEVMVLEAEIMDFKAGSFPSSEIITKPERKIEKLEDCLELNVEKKLESLPPPLVSFIDKSAAAMLPTPWNVPKLSIVSELPQTVPTVLGSHQPLLRVTEPPRLELRMLEPPQTLSKVSQNVPRAPEPHQSMSKVPQTVPRAPEPHQTVPRMPEPPQTIPKVPEPSQSMPRVPEASHPVPKVPEPPQTIPKVSEPSQIMPRVPEVSYSVPKVPEPSQPVPRVPEASHSVPVPSRSMPRITEPSRPVPRMPVPSRPLPRVYEPPCPIPRLPEPSQTMARVPEPPQPVPRVPEASHSVPEPPQPVPEPPQTIPKVSEPSQPVPRVPGASHSVPKVPEPSHSMPRITEPSCPVPRMPEPPRPVPGVPEQSQPVPRVLELPHSVPRVAEPTHPLPRVSKLILPPCLTSPTSSPLPSVVTRPTPVSTPSLSTLPTTEDNMSPLLQLRNISTSPQNMSPVPVEVQTSISSTTSNKHEPSVVPTVTSSMPLPTAISTIIHPTLSQPSLAIHSIAYHCSPHTLPTPMETPEPLSETSPETPVVQFTLFSNYSAFFDSDNEDDDKAEKTAQPSQQSEIPQFSTTVVSEILSSQRTELSANSQTLPTNHPTTSDTILEKIDKTNDEENKMITSRENNENHTPNNLLQNKTIEISGQCYFCCSDAKIACRRCAAALYCSSRCELEHSAIHRRECGKPTIAPFS